MCSTGFYAVRLLCPALWNCKHESVWNLWKKVSEHLACVKWTRGAVEEERYMGINALFLSASTWLATVLIFTYTLHTLWRELFYNSHEKKEEKLYTILIMLYRAQAASKLVNA